MRSHKLATLMNRRCFLTSVIRHGGAALLSGGVLPFIPRDGAPSGIHCRARLNELLPDANEPEARNAIIEMYLPVVGRMANCMSWFLPYHRGSRDTITAGYLGLFTALNTADRGDAAGFDRAVRRNIISAILSDGLFDTFRSKGTVA